MTLAKISLASAAAITLSVGGLWLKKIKTRAGSASLITSMVRLLFNMRQPELLAQSAHLLLSTSTKYKTASRPKTYTPATKWTSPQPRLAAS